MPVRTSPSRLPLIAFLLFIVGVVAAAWTISSLQERAELDARYKELTAVGQLKVNEIAEWRAERIRTAHALSESPLFVETLVTLQHASATASVRQSLVEHLAVVAARLKFTGVLVRQPDGTPYLASDASHDPRELSAETRRVIAAAVAGPEPLLGDLYRCPVCGRIHVDTAAAVRVDGRTIAVLVLQSDPTESLYPVLQSWPSGSLTAETLLVRRDQNDVLFLNELRHRQGTALVLRTPVDTALPAAAAVSGHIGRYVGPDYRGHPVLSDIRPVPGSGWFMVAKIDLDEALAQARFRTAAIIALAIVAVALAGVTVALFSRQRQRDTYRQLYESEQARRQSEGEFRATVYSIGDGVITTDAAARVRHVNRVAESLVGWTEAEAAGRPITEVFPIVNEETGASVANPVEKVLETGRIVGLANHTVLIARDGTRRPIADSGAPITTAAATCHGVVLVFRDQTAERRTEHRYRWLSSMLELSVNEVYSFDATTLKFIYVSPSALANLGFTLDEMQQMTPLDIKPMMSPERFETIVAPLRSRAQASADFETVHRRKDGTQYDVLLALRLIDAEPGPQFLAMGLDVTNRKQLEGQLQQAQRMEAVGRLAGGIAHDFNNLLSVINNYAEFGVEEASADSRLREYFGEILASGQRAEILTRQLLAFSRKQVMQPDVLNLNAVVDGVTALLRRLIGEDIRLTVRTDRALHNVKADRAQLEQVLVNLAVNARDAMPNGGELTIETANVQLDEGYAANHVGVIAGHYIVLSVSDTGIGMDEATRSRVFEPFFTTKPIGKGTGLGLAMVYGVVKQSGGNVWVYSEPGKGTTFKVYLPVAAESLPPIDVREPVGLTHGRESLLLVEDEAAVRRLARKILEMAGYRVIVAETPEEALRLCATADAPLDLLITDVVMPQMSGKQLAEQLVAQCPTLKVLYMSGYTENAIVHHGVLDVGTEFIAKPFTAAGLTRKVGELLQARSNPQV